MYRVAVVLNESELLRSGYANVTPKLKSIPQLAGYLFESFTTVNIQSLFEKGDNHISKFDSVLVTTNATSDKSVLDSLRQHSDDIKEFLEAGKGIFISSQKKLSADEGVLEKGEGDTRFLPSHYDFFTAERPKEERDSGQGKISVSPDGADHLLLAYPEEVTVEAVNQRCRANEFRRHFYRSYLQAKSSGAYLPLLVDMSYKDPSTRILAMVAKTPQKKERIVTSTIALDWEFHDKLLANIVKYVTEGPPRVAFIKKPAMSDGDYEFLLTGTALSKTPHVVYSDPSKIPEKLIGVINSFVFSRGWSDAEVTDFVRSDRFNRGSDGSAVYRRIYYFQQIGGFLFLGQHSTFSTLDVMINESAAWLSSQFTGKLWGGSFWITHDVLDMMHSNGIDCRQFVAPVLTDIRRHMMDGSYDGVMGVTCGLLDTVVDLQRLHQDLCVAAGFGPKTLNEISGWVVSHTATQSPDDKAIAFLSLNRLLASGMDASKLNLPYNQTTISNLFNEAIRGLDGIRFEGENLTEIDLCRWIELCLRSDETPSRALPLLQELERRQTGTGGWTDTTRTAHVLVFLLENFDTILALKGDGEPRKRYEEMVHNGITYLRERYSEKAANWDNDLQATAKAVHAIGLYNRRFKYSTQDFLTALKGDSEHMENITLIGSLSRALDNLRREGSEYLMAISKLQAKVRQNARIKRFEFAWRLVAFASLTLFLAMLGFIAGYHPDVLNEMIQSIGIPGVVIGAIISLVVALVAGRFVQRAKTEVEDLESLIKKKEQT